MKVRLTVKSFLLLLSVTLLSLLNAPLVVFADDEGKTLSKEREKVVKYMRAMGTVPWKPAEDLIYWVPSVGVIFHQLESYEGIPYTQRHRETNLEVFKSFLEKDGRYTGPADYVGNDCSSAVSSAWRQVDPNMPFLSTIHMFPGMDRILAVGDYEVTSMESTEKIIEDNGAERIKKAFDQLKPGDVILWRQDGNGHVRLVSDIDVEKQTVTIIEQTGLSKGKFKGKKGTWRVDYPFTYDELIENGYIPITCSALAGQ